MSERRRRDVLAYAGLAVTTTGLLSTAGAATSASGDGDGATTTVPDGWSSLGGDPGNTRYVPDERGPDAPIAPVWEHDSSGRIAVVDGTVYLVTADDDEVHALGADDGALEWQTEVAGADGAPAVAHETVYVGGERLTAIDAADGDVRWDLELEYEWAVPSPAVVDELVFVVADGTLHAVDAAEGVEWWQFEPEGEPLNEQSVAIADGVVVTASESQLYALDVHDGTERWTYHDSSDESLSTEFSPSQIAYPIATDDFVVAMRKNDELTLHDIDTGDERRRIDGFQRPEGAVTDDRIYNAEGMHNYYVSAHNLDTENDIWQSEETGQGTTAPLTDGERVYTGISSYGEFSDGEEGDRFYAFDADDGTIEWEINTENRLWPLALVDGTIYAGGLSGGDQLIALRTESAVEDDGDEDDAADDDENGNSDDTDEESTETEPDDESTDNGADDQNGADETDSTDDSAENEEDDRPDESEDDGESEPTENESGNGSEDGTGDDTDDGVPGFTAGAGVAGGALTFEWLRRRTPSDDAEH